MKMINDELFLSDGFLLFPTSNVSIIKANGGKITWREEKKIIKKLFTVLFCLYTQGTQIVYK